MLSYTSSYPRSISIINTSSCITMFAFSIEFWVRLRVASLYVRLSVASIGCAIFVGFSICYLNPLELLDLLSSSSSISFIVNQSIPLVINLFKSPSSLGADFLGDLSLSLELLEIWEIVGLFSGGLIYIDPIWLKLLLILGFRLTIF